MKNTLFKTVFINRIKYLLEKFYVFKLRLEHRYLRCDRQIVIYDPCCPGLPECPLAELESGLAADEVFFFFEIHREIVCIKGAKE